MRDELAELHTRLSGIAHDDPLLEPLLERAGELQHHLEDKAVVSEENNHRLRKILLK
jgi:hypothetical protein